MLISCFEKFSQNENYFLETGTSTAVIAILKPRTKTIATTLLGDSAYMIIRPKKDSRIDKLYRSIEQQHYFDCPFQWGTRGDNPSKARDEEHSVLHNDIIVMGTDGVWDNCFDKELIDIIKQSIDSNGNLIDPQNGKIWILFTYIIIC